MFFFNSHENVNISLNKKVTASLLTITSLFLRNLKLFY